MKGAYAPFILQQKDKPLFKGLSYYGVQDLFLMTILKQDYYNIFFLKSQLNFNIFKRQKNIAQVHRYAQVKK